MAFSKNQSLNDWLLMLEIMYGGTQNYAKTPYEIHSHLTEVCGIFAKHQFKRRDTAEAAKFLPKIFAWATALLKKVRPDKTNLEEVILRKFPGVCPYCAGRPCVCWKAEKPTLDSDSVRRLYYQNAPSMHRTPNDFQMMFREIYGESWVSQGTTDPIRYVYIRLTEELAEVAESVRFHHIYPENLENELADLFAWWFALVSCMSGNDGQDILLAEECLWKAYPGVCKHCQMLPCYCRPGPVRELMSKPAPGQDHRFDALTGTHNQGAYNDDIKEILGGKIMAAPPVACARIDVDNFKSVNDVHGHPAGDAALRHIASVLQLKVRERDRLYRVGGDEFAVLFFDFSEEEAAGLLRRVCSTLQESPVRWVSAKGEVSEFTVSVSVGVAECIDAGLLNEAFERADKAAYSSKSAGKARVTLSSSIAPE